MLVQSRVERGSENGIRYNSNGCFTVEEKKVGKSIVVLLSGEKEIGKTSVIPPTMFPTSFSLTSV